MQKSLKLEELKVKSFVTIELADEVRGGNLTNNHCATLQGLNCVPSDGNTCKCWNR